MAPEGPRRRRSDHFAFKEFSLDQTGCSMRISSDATIFGAYVPIGDATRILDIGTGTGVLALMLAQRARPDVSIDAVEISPTAFARAKANCDDSRFAAMIRVYHADIIDHAKSCSTRYDLIISNPPYFQNALLPEDDTGARLARHAHAGGLEFAGLIAAISQLLTEDGVFWLILPTRESEIFDTIAKSAGFTARHRARMRHDATSPVSRVITAYRRSAGDLVEADIIRHQADNAPTAQVKDLLRSYMLHY